MPEYKFITYHISVYRTVQYCCNDVMMMEIIMNPMNVPKITANEDIHGTSMPVFQTLKQKMLIILNRG